VPRRVRRDAILQVWLVVLTCAAAAPGFVRAGGDVGSHAGRPCGSVGRAICFSAPREHFRRTAGWRHREWNFEEIEAYHWGASGVGGDEWQAGLAADALDGWFGFEYDSRLSRKRDSEQEIRCLTIESGIRMCEANS
jgi:hypothetical protein